RPLRRTRRGRACPAPRRLLAVRPGQGRPPRPRAGAIRYIRGEHLSDARPHWGCTRIGHFVVVLATAGRHSRNGTRRSLCSPIPGAVRSAPQPPYVAGGDGPFGSFCVFAVIPLRWLTDYGRYGGDRGFGISPFLRGFSAGWGGRTDAVDLGGLGAGPCRVVRVVDGASAPGGRLGGCNGARVSGGRDLSARAVTAA